MKQNDEGKKINHASFGYLIPFLKYAGFTTKHLPISSENLCEQLFVSLVEEEEKYLNNLFVQIFFANDMLAEDTDGKDNFQMLQFFIPLAINFDNDKKSEISLLLLRFNDAIPIGAFGLGSDKIYFKYSLMTKDRTPDEEMLIEIIQMISFFVKNFASKLNDFINGIKNTDQIIIELENRI